MSRFRGKIPFNPSVTQKVKNALYDAGREDLVQALYESGLAELEEDLDLLRKRVAALEQEKVKWQTESGVHRIISATVKDTAVDWGQWAVKGTIGTAAAALAGWVAHLAWKGFRT